MSAPAKGYISVHKKSFTQNIVIEEAVTFAIFNKSLKWLNRMDTIITDDFF